MKKKVILVATGDTAGMQAELQALKGEIESYAKCLLPTGEDLANGSWQQWLQTHSADVDSIVVFPAAPAAAATGQIAGTPEPPFPLAPPSFLAHSSLPVYIVLSTAANRAHIPAEFANKRTYDLSTDDGWDAFRCALVHERPVARARFDIFALPTLGLFMIFFGFLAQFIGSLTAIQTFLIDFLGKGAARVLYILMSVLILALLLGGVLALVAWAIGYALRHFGRTLGGLSRKKQILAGAAIAAVMVPAAIWAYRALPRPPDIDRIIAEEQAKWADRLVLRSLVPGGGVQVHPERQEAQVWSTAQALAGLLRSKNFGGATPQQLRAAFAFIERMRIVDCTITVEELANLEKLIGRANKQLEAAKLPLRYPTVPFALAQIPGELGVSPAPAQMQQLEQHLRSISKDHHDGWGYFAQHGAGITEIAAWVAVAYAYSLRQSERPVWPNDQRAEIESRLGKILDHIAQREINNSGAYSPISDVSQHSFARTYSTIMAVWAFSEALQPGTTPHMESQQRHDIRVRIQRILGWLDRTGQPDGWKINPTNPVREESFVGFTAQILWILTRVPTDASNPDYEKFKTIKRAFVDDHAELRSRKVDHNDRMHDSDRYLSPSPHAVEGSTFLWYPWSVNALRHLKAEVWLEPDHKRNAEDLLDHLHTHVADFGKFLQTEYNYIAAEALLCFPAKP